MSLTVQTPLVNFDSIDTSRYEQVDGQLVERPMPKFRHAQVQTKLIALLVSKLADSSLGAYVELSLDKDDARTADWMTPDILVVESDRVTETKRGNVMPPVPLAIEVFSPDQTVPEMIRKANRFIAWGVKQVWLIDPEKQFAISITEDNYHNPPVLLPPDSALQIAGLSISLADIFS